jgi:hypothetical protein
MLKYINLKAVKCELAIVYDSVRNKLQVLVFSAKRKRQTYILSGSFHERSY